MSEFKTFKLGELFSIEKVRGINKSKLNINSNGKYDYVTRTSKNNGIESITDDVSGTEPNEPNTFSLGLLQMTFFYRERPWYAGQFVRKIVPKHRISRLAMLYLLTHLRKLSNMLLSVLVRDVDDVFNQSRISLPVNSETQEIDWQYMEDRVKVLEQDRVKALEMYLQSVGLNDSHLTPNEKKVLDNQPTLKAFSLGASYMMRGKLVNVDRNGLFNIVPTQKKINANTITLDGQFPYVARGESQNSIRGYVNFNEAYLNPGNTISFGQDTATINYQPNPYFTGDKVQVLKLNPKYGCLNEIMALYLISAMKKAFKNFIWGQQSFSLDVIANMPILLPVDQSNNIDFNYMETYIRAMQKLVIKDVVNYKDKIIENTQRVISGDSKNR